MSPTPIHVTKAESEAAHMHRCENEEGGPVFEMKTRLESMSAKVDKVMLRQAAWNGGALVLQIIGMAIFGAWISSRFAQSQPRAISAPPALINQAHAETKGSP